MAKYLKILINKSFIHIKKCAISYMTHFYFFEVYC